MAENVLLFKPYEFEAGQKIHITGGKRKGDWEIVDYDGEKVTLQCPVSGVKLSVAQFCFFVDEEIQEWPQKE
jgi:hypothetical protein